MKEFVVSISDEKYEHFLEIAEKITKNYRKSDGKERTPERMVEFAVGLGINHHINENLLAILDESERALEKAQERGK